MPGGVVGSKAYVHFNCCHLSQGDVDALEDAFAAWDNVALEIRDYVHANCPGGLIAIGVIVGAIATGFLQQVGADLWTLLRSTLSRILSKKAAWVVFVVHHKDATIVGLLPDRYTATVDKAISSLGSLLDTAELDLKDARSMGCRFGKLGYRYRARDGVWISLGAFRGRSCFLKRRRTGKWVRLDPSRPGLSFEESEFFTVAQRLWPEI